MRHTPIGNVWDSICKIGVVSPERIIDFASLPDVSIGFSSERTSTVKIATNLETSCGWGKGTGTIISPKRTTVGLGAHSYPTHSMREKNGMQKQWQLSTLIFLGLVVVAGLMITKHGEIIGVCIQSSGRR
jgi:hypothetical protein